MADDAWRHRFLTLLTIGGSSLVLLRDSHCDGLNRDEVLELIARLERAQRVMVEVLRPSMGPERPGHAWRPHRDHCGLEFP